MKKIKQTTFHLEYIWIGGNKEIRGKTKIIKLKNHSLHLNNCPIWNYDGSSTNQASGDDSEVMLHPVRLYNNPFRPKYSYLVLCQTMNKDGTSHTTNTRHDAETIFNKYQVEHKPLYGIEQEFFMIDNNTKYPLGYNPEGDNKPQGSYYCSVGTNNCFGRNISDEMLNACLRTKLNITGLNFEVAPGQCELQLCETGIKAADDLIILRYILHRVGENHNISIDISSKPLEGDWNGSGCHVNFSTQAMRNENGYDLIIKSMNKLEAKHKEHIDVYGDDNNLRLTGEHETSSIDKFSYGVANRGASIRIPNSTFIEQKGYFEDRRPSSSMDPYLVLSKLLDTVCS
mgnify:CR=1 FL=1